MNKKYFIIFALMIVLFSCNHKRTGNNESSFAKEVMSPTITEDTITKGCEGITLNISNSYIPSNLEVIMTNNSNYTTIYGIGWMLYFKKDSNWVVCKPEFIFEDIGRAMYPDQKDTLYLPLDQFKLPLESGEYKLVKDITLNNQECRLIKYFKMEF